MFEIIDFDERFADFTSDWMEKHRAEYRNFDAMEADVPRIYRAFLNTPADWLDGVTPGAFFTQYEDPKDLVDWLAAYCAAGVPVPELLMEQIESGGQAYRTHGRPFGMPAAFCGNASTKSTYRGTLCFAMDRRTKS